MHGCYSYSVCHSCKANDIRSVNSCLTCELLMVMRILKHTCNLSFLSRLFCLSQIVQGISFYFWISWDWKTQESQSQLLFFIASASNKLLLKWLTVVLLHGVHVHVFVSWDEITREPHYFLVRRDTRLRDKTVIWRDVSLILRDENLISQERGNLHLTGCTVPRTHSYLTHTHTHTHPHLAHSYQAHIITPCTHWLLNLTDTHTSHTHAYLAHTHTSKYFKSDL